MYSLKEETKWFITIEPIIVREKNRVLDPREVGNRFIYSIIDQQMDVENAVIPSWLSMLIAGLDISTLKDISPEVAEEILSSILYSHGAPRFYTSSDLEKMGLSRNISLPSAIVKAVKRLTSVTRVKLRTKNIIILWRNLNEFAKTVREYIMSGRVDEFKSILAKGRDPSTNDKLFSLMGEAVADFFLRDIDLKIDKSQVPLKIDVNNFKSGRLTGFFFEDKILNSILLSAKDVDAKRELYIKHIFELKQHEKEKYGLFQEIIRDSAKNSFEAKDINRFLFILGSDYCEHCLTNIGNEKCPLYGFCLFSRILNSLKREQRRQFSNNVKKAIQKEASNDVR